MEAPLEDVAEQGRTDEEAGPGTLDVEAPEADAVEQHTPVGPGPYTVEHEVPAEADEADVREQQEVVAEPEEEDYR